MLFNLATPKIRTARIPVKRSASDIRAQEKADAEKKNGASNKTIASKSSTQRLSEPANRFKLTPTARTTSRKFSKSPADPSRRSSSLSTVPSQRKRKGNTPSTPQWASSSSESESDDDALQKRQKTSAPTEVMSDFRKRLEPDPKRHIAYEDRKTAEEKKDDPVKRLRLIQGLDMSKGEKESEGFVAAFKKTDVNNDEKIVVELQYPSSHPPEKFETVTPKDRDNWDPLQDIEYSVEEIIQNYLPPSLSVDLLDETTGTVRLLKRAVAKNSPSDFQATLTDFNELIRTNFENGTIHSVLDSMTAVPLSLVNRILAQVYQRTVSPYAHLLRAGRKENGTTYGELLPSFVHKIFHQTHLNSSCVFVDLGSGVGNVVLQAALQTGAESWGVEVMDKPAALATAQAKELRARARMWNIKIGPMRLLHGDFLETPEIDKVLCRADVVLVNNKVFPEKLNGRLLDKFLDLKQGARVVSLQSFTPGERQGARNEQNVASLFDEEEFHSGTQSVSWTGESVEYFIATKVR